MAGPPQAQSQFIKKRAPTLYIIIAIKLLKAASLLALALGVYSLSDNNLPAEFRKFLEFLHLDPEKKFFTDLAAKIETITPANVISLALGTMLYAMFSLVEGIGLIFRAPWAGRLAIGESAFFIPIELREVVGRFSWTVVVILAVNVWIVWYLYANRQRLFRHHHH